MCLIGIVLALLLQKNNPELAILLALSVCGGVLLFGLSRIKDVFAVLEQMAQAGYTEETLMDSAELNDVLNFLYERATADVTVTVRIAVPMVITSFFTGLVGKP